MVTPNPPSPTRTPTPTSKVTPRRYVEIIGPVFAPPLRRAFWENILPLDDYRPLPSHFAAPLAVEDNVTDHFSVRFAADFQMPATKDDLAAMLNIRPYKIRHIFRRLFAGATLTLEPEDVTKIMALGIVDAVEKDSKMYLMQDPLNMDGVDKGQLSWALDRIDQRALPLDGKFDVPDVSSPVRIYLVDSGVARSRIELRDVITGWLGVAAPLAGYMENFCNVHGTKMASIMADPHFGISQVMEIVDVAAFACDVESPELAIGTSSDIAYSLERILIESADRQDFLPGVVSMSLAGRRNETLNLAVKAFVETTGFPVVVAAGNAPLIGDDYQPIDACGLSPASAPESLTVAAFGIWDGQEKLAPFSNIGDCVDIAAPGVNMTVRTPFDDGVYSSSGTSDATALVSAMAAYLIATGENPSTVMQSLIDNGPRLSNDSALPIALILKDPE